LKGIVPVTGAILPDIIKRGTGQHGRFPFLRRMNGANSEKFWGGRKIVERCVKIPIKINKKTPKEKQNVV